MDETRIKVGDVAYVYRGCIHCGDTSDLGEVIVVSKINDSCSILECCGIVDKSPGAYYEADNTGAKYLWCLKKIPPLEELETTKVDEELPVEVT